jgi:hypothetical protein
MPMAGMDSAAGIRTGLDHRRANQAHKAQEESAASPTTIQAS